MTLAILSVPLITEFRYALHFIELLATQFSYQLHFNELPTTRQIQKLSYLLPAVNNNAAVRPYYRKYGKTVWSIFKLYR